MDIPHRYTVIEDVFCGPVVGFWTPFDTVVTLAADPQNSEARERLFALRFPDDLVRFPQELPLVGFVCGSPLLDSVMDVERFFDIEPDQVEQTMEVFTRHLTDGGREMVLRALELG